MENRTITVTGLGRERIAPDQIVINITLEAKDEDYSAVNALQSEQASELKEAAEQMGFEKGCLKTASFNIDTEYENYQTEKGNWARQFKGYCCRHTLTLKFDSNKDMLNGAVKAITSCKKSTPTFNIQFTVKDKEQFTDSLLQKAVKDAFRKAEVIASASGMKLGSLISISYMPESASIVSPTAARAELYRGVSVNDAAGVEIEAENIEGKAEIKAVWEILA